VPKPLTTYLRLYREAFVGLPRVTWVIAFVGLVNRAGTMVVPFLTLYFKASLGFSAGEAGMLFGTWGVGALVGAYVGGWASDRFGAVRVQVVTLILCGLGFFWLGQCESWHALGVALFATGVVFSAFRPANASTLASTCPPSKRSQAFALHRLAINLGMAIGPASGGFLARIDYSWLFGVDGSVCILSGLLLAVLLRGVNVAPVHDEPDTGQDGSPWRDRPFLGLLLVTLASSFIMFQWFATGSIFFHDVYGMEPDEIGLLLGLNPVLIVAFEMVLVQSLRNRAPLPWIALGVGMLGLSCLMLPVGATFAWAILAVVIWTFGEMFESPLTGAFVANRAGPEHRGRYMGALNIAFASSAILAPVAGLQVYEVFGPTTMWVCSGCVGLVAACFALILARRVATS
jgi:MFS family permease